MQNFRLKQTSSVTTKAVRKSNQGRQDSRGNQENVIKRQRPNTENRQTQQRTLSNFNNIYKVIE